MTDEKENGGCEMTLKESIRTILGTNDPKQIRRLVETLAGGGIAFQGQKVFFDSRSRRELFQRADPTIDNVRFEELMMTADLE
jgi:hypothetical protein